ncbi:MAG: dihydroorotate dehydrogenase electron transfer subunit [Dehalococcoidia bacterium]
MEDRLSKILAKQVPGPGICCLWVDAPHVAVSAWAGEFVMVTCGSGSDPLLRRALTVNRYGPRVLANEKNGPYPEWITPSSIALLFNTDGPARRWLGAREVGEEIEVLGPLGRGFELEPAATKIVLAGGGTGIAPLIALIDEALTSAIDVTLICAGRTEAALYPRELVQPQVKYVPVTEDGSVGQRGLITDCLSPYAQEADQIFLCGPVPMYKAAHSACKKLGIQKQVQVLLEVRMACGFGICYGCSIPTKSGVKMVCRDGPKFALDEVLWERL